MESYIEVSCYEEASHVEILHNKYSALKITEGKIYELHHGFIGQNIGKGENEEPLDECYIYEDTGLKGHGFMMTAKKKWLKLI